MKKEHLLMDYKYYGLPDMSFHGSRAWYPELDHYNRHIGVMLCGRYAGEESNVYIAFNLHWEEHELALPTIPSRQWRIILSTSRSPADDLCEEHFLTVEPRSIIVLVDEKK